MEVTLREQVDHGVAQAQHLVINDQRDYATAAAMLQAIVELEKRIKAFYEPKKAAARKPWKELCDEENMLLEGPNTASSIVRKKMSLYHAAQEEERKQEEERLRALAVEGAEGTAAPVDNVMFSLGRAQQPEGITQRTVWKWRVVDFEAVPLGYKLINDKALNEMAKRLKDKASLPGVEFYSEYVTTVR
jgi:hypothetical protein